MPRTLVINPRSDEPFNVMVRRTADAVATTVELEAQLRTSYPSVRVRERTLSHEGTATWYVYREGIWIPERLSDLEDDIKATGADIATDAARVRQLEIEKVELSPRDPRRTALAHEAERLTAEMAAKAKVETALVEEAAAESRQAR